MTVKILADSINTVTRDRITTYLIEGFPKCLLAEFNTHSLICRNWESSRARPTAAVLKQVLEDPYIPIVTKNQRGMSGEIITNPQKEINLILKWREQMVSEIESAISEGFDLHKQTINRYLEPWLRVSGIATSTFWDVPNPDNPGFFQLRNHKDADPNFQIFAKEMEEAYRASIPVILEVGEWHKPWKDESLELNTARCAGVSYASHNKDVSEEKRIALHDSLKESKHLSPFSHCAICIDPGEIIYHDHIVFDSWNLMRSIQNCRMNYRLYNIISTAQYGGFLQYRKLIEKGIEYDKI